MEMLFTKTLGEIVGTKYEERIREFVDGFVCEDKAVELFLKIKSFEFEKRNKSRTYLVFDDEKAGLLGYFTLSLKSLVFRNNLPKGKIKDIDGFSKEVRSVAIVLIGQFGKDESQAKETSGKELLKICLDKIYQAHSLIGGRYALIECHNTDKVVNFYCENGFDFLQPDLSNSYLQMVRRL
jgi:hypothetical protein